MRLTAMDLYYQLVVVVPCRSMDAADNNALCDKTGVVCLYRYVYVTLHTWVCRKGGRYRRQHRPTLKSFLVTRWNVL